MTSIKVKIYFKEEIRRLQITKQFTFEEFLKKISEFVQLKDLPTFKYLDVDKDWITFSSNDEWKEALENYPTEVPLQIKVIPKQQTQNNSNTTQQNNTQNPFNVDPNILGNLFSNLGPILNQFKGNFQPQSNSNNNTQNPFGGFGLDPKLFESLSSNFGPVLNQFKESFEKNCCSTSCNSTNNTNDKSKEVKHHGIVCDGCEVSPIVGVRHKCNSCKDFDLCSKCFDGNNKHDKAHTFSDVKYPIGSCSFFKNFMKEAFQNNSENSKNNSANKVSADEEIIVDKDLYEDNNSMKVDTKLNNNNIQEVKVNTTTEVKKPTQAQQQVNNSPTQTQQQQQPLTQNQQPFQFNEQLELLKSMGFHNDSLNVYLLNKFQGNIQKVVGELLTNSGLQK